MKIEQYISQLLYRYPCVTVPGFGAFLSESQPAQLDESSNAFYPPKKLISFNAMLRNNDGLLAQHVARIEGRSFEDALEAIRSEVSIWTNILQLNNKFILKNVGEIALNPEGKMVFTPYENLNYLTDSFGLSSFVSPAVKREVYKKQVEALEEKTQIAILPDSRRPSHAWKYAAVFVVALSAAGVFGVRMYNENVAREALAVEKQVQQDVQQKIQEATFFIDNPIPAVTLSVKDDKMPYHVVAGAFRLESNAVKAHQQLSKLGFKSRKLEPNGHGLHPVLYGSFPTYKDAYRAMSKIKRTHNPDAWLLIKEL